MDVRDQTDSNDIVELSRCELWLINNALNEVRNRLHVPEFHTRLGATRNEAEVLLDQVHRLVEERRSRPPSN
jgi:hypothetical protein